MFGRLRKKLSGSSQQFSGVLFVSVVLKFGGAFASYAFLLGFSNILDEAAFGGFAMLLSLANFAMILASFGQPLFILRNLSVSNATKDYASRQQVLSYSLRVTALGLLLGCLFVSGFGLVSTFLGMVYHWKAYLAVVGLTTTLVLAELVSHISRADGMVILAVFPKEWAWRAIAPMVAFGILAYYGGLSLTQAIAICALTLLLIVLIQIYYLDRNTERLRVAVSTSLPEKVFASWRIQSFYFWSISVSSGLIQHLTVVLVGFSLSPEELGAFFAAFRTASLLTMPLTAANLLLAPTISRLYHKGKLDELADFLRIFYIGVVPASLFGLLILAAYGDLLLSLFDESYPMAWAVLICFSIGFVINLVYGPCGYVMSMTGNEKTFLKVSLITNATGTLVAGVLATQGMIWASLAIIATSTLVNIIAAAWVRRHIGIETTIAILWQRDRSV